MKQETLQMAHIQARRIYNLLCEVLDLSRQLAEAIDRDDQVSIQMVLAMRGEPLQKIAQVRGEREQMLESLPPPDARRLRELLDGRAAKKEEEKGLAGQVAANMRLLEQIRELDQRLNQKITRDKSIYDKK